MAKGAVASVTFVANAKSLISATKNINRNLSTLTKGFSRVSTFAKAAFGIFVANKAIGGLKGIISAGEQAVATTRRLQQVFANQGLVGSTAFKQLSKNARDLSLDIGVTGGAVQEVQAKLALFGGAFAQGTAGAKLFAEATKLAFDFEAAGLGDALQGAKVLGKALEDPASAVARLAKAGILLGAEQAKAIKTLVEQGKIAEAQALIIQSVQGIIGGTALATASNSAKIKVAIDDIVESFGTLLLPILDPVAKGFRIISDAVTGSVEKSGGLTGIWNNFLVPIGRSVITTLDSLRKSLGFTNEGWNNFISIIKVVLGFFANLLSQIFQNTALNDTLVKTLKKLFDAFAAVAQVIGEILFPVIKVLAEILGTILGVALTVIIKVLQFFATIWLNLASAISEVIQYVANALLGFKKFIKDVIPVQAAITALGAVFGALGTFLSDLGKVLGESFIGELLNALKSGISKVFNFFNEVKTKVGDFFSGLFDNNKQTDFKITTPEFKIPKPPTLNIPNNTGQIRVPESSVPKKPSTIVKELPTNKPKSLSAPVSNFNYSINVSALTPTPQVGKVVVESIKQFQQRSGIRLSQ